MPRPPVVLLVPQSNVVRPPIRLHEQHLVTLDDGNILKPRLPLVRVPGMFHQHCFYLPDSLWVLLLKDLVSDDPREHMTGNVPGRSERGRYGKREKYEGCD